jgi:phosphoribosyl 1,2-cyclic phosphate phosphodiesterase
MEINILGSGGINPPPRPGCQCRICKQARSEGAPFYRTGSSLFIYNESLLVDTPKDIRQQLNREDIDMVENLLLPDWRPEHILGLSILEKLNYDAVSSAPIWDPINVYIPSEIGKQDFFHKLLHKYQDELGIIKIILMNDCQILEIGGLRVLPVKFDSVDGFYFVIYDNGAKIVYVPARYLELNPVSEAYDADIFIVPCHYWEDKTVFRREVISSSIEEEASFEKVLNDAESIRARKIVLTGIEEDFGMSYRDLKILPNLKYKEWNLEFAYDGMRISI